MQHCLLSWRAEPGKKSGNCTWLCLPCWHRAVQRIDLIYPGRAGCRGLLLALEGGVKHSTFGVLPLAGLGKDGEVILCQAALASTCLCGLHPAPREDRLWHGGWSLYPNLEYLFLWTRGCSCNLYKVTLLPKEMMGLVWSNSRVVPLFLLWLCDMKSCVLHFWSPVAWRGKEAGNSERSPNEAVKREWNQTERKRSVGGAVIGEMLLSSDGCRWEGMYLSSQSEAGNSLWVSVSYCICWLLAELSSLLVGCHCREGGSELWLDCGCPRHGCCALHGKMCWWRGILLAG